MAPYFSLDGSPSGDQRCQDPLYSLQRFKLYISATLGCPWAWNVAILFVSLTTLYIMNDVCAMSGARFAQVCPCKEHCIIIMCNIQHC